MLELRHVSKAFGGVQALHDVCATFLAGMIYAIVGPNGCGKTSLLNVISGFYRPDEGCVMWEEGGDGRVLRSTVSGRARLGIGRMFQEPRGFPDMTVEDNLLLALLEPGSDVLLGLGLRRIPRGALSGRIQYLLTLGRLIEAARQEVSTLSFGQRRILDLLILIARKPRAYLLDEPFAGVDPESVAILGRLIADRATSDKASIIVVSHEITIAKDLAHQMYVMDGGQVVMRGLPAEVMHQPEFREVYLS